MNSNNERIRDDEQYYYDTMAQKNVQRRNAFNWIPLLLIPLFFVLGWVTKGAYDAPVNSVNNPQYGVGGGPGDVTPYPAGYVAPQTAAPVTATIEPADTPTLDSEVQDSATPTATPTPRSTGTVTPTPAD